VTDGAALRGKEGIRGGREMARDRRAEQVRALDRLGVPAENVFFLGFPDGGIEKIRYAHRTSLDNAYFCPWLHADRSGKDSLAPGTPFNAECLTDLLVRVLGPLSPTHVFTHHARDRHPDHRGVTHFVRNALSTLTVERRLRAEPVIYEHLTYLPGMKWMPAGREIPVEAARALLFPGQVVDFRLTPGEEGRKNAALDCFVPILGPGYMDNWRRSNEIFWRTE
jgi:LmbE family N-acetylglucosaminyl deacetylase